MNIFSNKNSLKRNLHSMIFLIMQIKKKTLPFSLLSYTIMKLFVKSLLLLSIFVFFLWYSFAWKLPKITDQHSKSQQRSWVVLQRSWDKLPKLWNNAQQKSWTKLPCELETWFAEKIARLIDNCIQKIALLTKVNVSLEAILPLVKDATIQGNLQAKKSAVILMIKNYTALKITLEQNPQSTCWQKTPIWKTYNEETKVLVDAIKIQLNLLKK